jgi:chorismate mutase
MGLLTGLLTLPLAPLRGTVWVAERVAEEADRQLHDPARIRRRLEEVAAAREAGELDEAEAAAIERELVGRLLRERASRWGAAR